MNERERAAASNSDLAGRPGGEAGPGGQEQIGRSNDRRTRAPGQMGEAGATARGSDDAGAAARDRQPMDPTRKLLKVFGVKVTDYEARTDALLEGFDARATGDAAIAVVREVVELTADLDRWLREIQSHVLERQERVLSRLFEIRSKE